MANSITEEFTDSTGRFVAYDTIDYRTQTPLTLRKHIDLRSFALSSDTVPKTMNDLGGMALEGQTMTAIEAPTHHTEDEGWSAGTTGADSALGKRNSLRLTCTTGANATVSTMTAIDISGFASDDHLSLALPNFPAASLNLGASYVRFSDGTTTITLALNTCITPLTAGNCEARWPVSSLNGLSHITTVSFNFQATASCTVTVAAVRLLSKDWTATKLDINTLHQRLEPIVDRDGTIPATAFPLMWRASDPPGGRSDPRPFDSRLAFLFNTGSMSGTSSITAQMRERREDFLTQLDLNGIDLDSDGVLDIGADQGALDNYGHQPDFGISEYDTAPMSDFDEQRQSDLDTTAQAFLERLPDTIHQAWVSATMAWNSTNTTITVTNSETIDSNAYHFTSGVLTANTEYVLEVDLRDNDLRVQVFTIDGLGRVGTTPIFDSLKITDDGMFPRFKGRLGWDFNLADGDAYIKSVRSQYLMYGEYISHPFESTTPVVGARLYTSASPDQELYVGGEAYKNAVTTIDTSQSRSSDGSIRVTTNGPGGFVSLPMIFDSFTQTQISFDVLFPSSAGASLTLALLNDRGYFIELPVHRIVKDQWTKISLTPLQAQGQQTGSYRLVFLVTENVATTFRLDNISVRQRVLVWSGRAVPENPWGLGEATWTDFRDLINSDKDGILFAQRGRFAQVRGQATSPDAFIEKVYFKPKYAELGRFVWDAPDRAYNTLNPPGVLAPPNPDPTPDPGPPPPDDATSYAPSSSAYPSPLRFP